MQYASIVNELCIRKLNPLYNGGKKPIITLSGFSDLIIWLVGHICIYVVGGITLLKHNRVLARSL